MLTAFVCMTCVQMAVAADAPVAITTLVQAQRAGEAPLLLDVRHSDEYRDGHIADALNIPVEQLAERYTALGVPRDREIVVYCVSGRRAAHAQEILQAQGYSHVRLLEGSMNAWRQQRLPLVRESAEPSPQTVP
ncbi:rhodanese-like domain-containing protein [Dyella tabacisoli]|uniref:rhodanese-like domain-containing protein n=1 Tax=Dyella tabacisoli TaxID=2282381 RepID=UPI0013B41EBC|nr:rhodanese-like domain-containing protein [Dyella tabacisoli]